MSDIISELKANKRTIEDLQRQKARQEGQKEQLLKRLEREFNGSSREDAETKLEVLEKEFIQHGKTLNSHKEQMDEIIDRAHSKTSTGESNGR